MKKINYEIGGIKYYQQVLVMGQYRQLIKILETLRIPVEWDLMGVITAFGNRINEVMAIILIPEGVHPKDKDVEELAKTLDFEMDADMVFKVVSDFFVCNDMDSLLKKLTEAMKKATSKIEEEAEKNQEVLASTEMTP